MTGSTPEVRVYRWVICACSFLVLFVSQGMTLGGMAVFDIQLINSISAATGNEVSTGAIEKCIVLASFLSHDKKQVRV